MARMSGVPFLGIGDNGVQGTWDILCVHTIVGYQSGGNAAHFTTGATGRIVQARDTHYRSAANLNGNWHVIAIENEDHGSAYGSWSGSNVPAFTAAQAEAIAKILAWGHRAHGIPLVLVPDSKVGRRGIAYHRQGIDGNFIGPYRGRVSGGELWSSAYGKVCPGDRRIPQLINTIIPRARVLAGLEEDMATPQEIAAAVWAHNLEDGTWTPPGGNDRAVHAVAAIHQAVDNLPELEAKVDSLTAKADGLAARLDSLVLGGGTIDYAQLARAINDDADARRRDGDPTTGPVS